MVEDGTANIQCCSANYMFHNLVAVLVPCLTPTLRVCMVCAQHTLSSLYFSSRPDFLGLISNLPGHNQAQVQECNMPVSGPTKACCTVCVGLSVGWPDHTRLLNTRLLAVVLLTFFHSGLLAMPVARWLLYLFCNFEWFLRHCH